MRFASRRLPTVAKTPPGPQADPKPALAAGEQALDRRVGQLDKELVGLDRMAQAGARNAGESVRKAARHAVGVARVAQPEVVGEVAVELRAEEPHLREEMPAALAAECEI